MKSILGKTLQEIADETNKNEALRRAARNVIDAFEGHCLTNLQMSVLETLRKTLNEGNEK